MTCVVQPYSLEKFEEVANEGFEFTFNDEVLHIIQDIAEKVGAPGYIKTPIFAKKKKEKPSIKPTIFKKEITSLFDNVKQEIRISMNKISNDTYDMILKDISIKIDMLIEEKDKTEDQLEAELVQVGKLIFDLATFNYFYSKLYAKLYKDLMDKYTSFTNVLEKNFTTFTDYFKNITYVSPNDDYDAHCNYNVQKETRKSLTSFISELYVLDIIQEEYIIELINELYKQFITNIEIKEGTHISDEISENLKVLYSSTMHVLIKTPDWEQLKNIILETATLKPKSKPGFSSKSLFCYYDIRDKIKSFIQ